MILLALVTSATVYEARTSRWQAWYFSRVASTFGFVVGEGPSENIRFPSGGPHDERLGYPRIPELTRRLDSEGFDLTHQSRMTPSLLRWIDRGAHAIYLDKGVTGLQVRDRAGVALIDERHPRYAYAEFDSIPPLVWQTLLHIESRGFLESGGPRRNPAVEWDRLAFSVFSLVLREVGGSENVPGGSTLATQLEKFRHSPEGITRSPREKFHQMLSASLRAYSGGEDTYGQRRQTVTEYLNSVPLAAQQGFGEVAGLGEGLWAWYGTPFARANQILGSEPRDASERLEFARVYAQVLTLLVAQRRPTDYLARPDGYARLSAVTDRYLSLLTLDGIVPAWLEQSVRIVGSQAVRRAAPVAEQALVAPQSVNSLRAHLLETTGARSRYDLERLDLNAASTLDSRWDAAANRLLADLRDPDFLRSAGFLEDGLLRRGDPQGVTYSVLLLERTPLGNVVRVEADNYPGEMSLARASRLELGSTAKLRTLATYLEIIEEIRGRLVGLRPDSLATLANGEGDALSRWVAEELLWSPDAPLAELLDAALGRRYPASPQERFSTGGTELEFSNFDTRFDTDTLSVREAFRNSVNLPFIRVMQDLVAYEAGRLKTAELLAIEGEARRQEYLVKFAVHEGEQYVRRFHRRYRDRSGPGVFTALLANRGLSATQVAWAVRAVAPDAPWFLFEDMVRTHGSEPEVSGARLEALDTRTRATGLSLSDLGFLARVHPLELWVARERLRDPGASLARLLEEGRPAIVDSYGWLLRTSRQDAQDVRIRTVQEIEAFQEIHARWVRLGYPFDQLTPSLGTAIGSSGDQPMALAELVGLIMNDGVRLPSVSIESISVGERTPFETRFARRPEPGVRALSSEVASTLRAALRDVVSEGTGRRGAGALAGADGGALDIGGKTGTGDNRRQVHDARGRLLTSTVVGRTASFAFSGGDRFFGVVTAYVEGEAAAEYRFTSALPTQILRILGERWGPLDAPPAAGQGSGRRPPPSPVRSRRATSPLRFAADTLPVRDPGTNQAVEPQSEQLVTRTEVPPP